MDNITETVNITSLSWNGTTTEGATPLPATPPPLGYYGETKEMLWKVIPPIIMVWGTVGNFLTFLVLLRQKSKLSSTAMYLMALAISDTMVLYTGPLRQWLKQMWEYDIRYLTDAGCKIQVYITYASLHCSSWLLVAVTIERALSVVLPHKVKLGCTPRSAGIVIFAIVVFTYGINIANLVIYGSDAYRSTQKCAPTTKEYLDFRDDVFQWIDFLVAFALPFILLLAGNIIIIVYLQKSRAKQREMTAARGRAGGSSGRDTRSVSVLMVALCVIFFFTMTPASIFNIYYPYRQDEIFELFETDPRAAWYDYQFFLYQHAIVNLVSYTNASFNFILYVFSGTKFRKELRALFHCDTAGTTGVFGSRGTKYSSKTGTTSLSATKTQLRQDKETSFQKESFKNNCNDVQTEENVNGVVGSTFTADKSKEIENTDGNLKERDTLEKILKGNGEVFPGNISENVNEENLVENENSKPGLDSTNEKTTTTTEEMKNGHMKQDDDFVEENNSTSSTAETASVCDVNLKVNN